MSELEQVAAMVAAGDRAGATALVESYGARVGLAALVRDLFAPLLRGYDDQRAPDGTYPLAQIYVASKVVEDALNRFGEEYARLGRDVPNAGVAVIGNIEDDCHALGRRLIGVFLRAAGWQVHDLGVDVPAAEFVAKAKAVGAHVIGVSAMLYRTAEGIRAVRDRLDAEGLSGRVRLAVGGAVFRLRPDLTEEVGGDGTATHAAGAVALFARLRQASEERR